MKLRGIIPPLVTPLLSTEQLDVPGLERLIEHVIGGGVHGIFLLGTTGEGADLSPRLQREMVQRSIQQTAGRIPVLVCVTNSSFEEVLSLSNFAAEAGATALVLASPYYFPAGQQELLEYLEHLVPRLPLPLLLYNMPSMTKVDLTTESLRRAADIPGLVGLKDSSGNMVKFHEFLTAMRDRPDFTMLMGPEELMAEAVLFGGDGGISGGANLCPKLYVQLYEAAVRGDLPEIRRLQQMVFLLRRIYFCGNFASTLIKGVKCALHLRGICSDVLAEPFNHFGEAQRKQIAKYLDDLAACGL